MSSSEHVQSGCIFICLAVPYAVQCCVICILLKFYSINSKPDLKPLCEGLLGSFEKLVDTASIQHSGGRLLPWLFS